MTTAAVAKADPFAERKRLEEQLEEVRRERARLGEQHRGWAQELGQVEA
jgi:hypothetical protein